MIIAKFDLCNQIRKMAEADALHGFGEKFVAPDINLSHHDAIGPDGSKLPGLTNLGMGYVFEELIRKFNEENNEEAGEHFTPREVIHLLFEPVKKKLPPFITIYDPACGSGGMLTEAQDFIIDPEGSIYLYGKSWKTDQGQILEKNGANTVIIDPRFEVKLPDASGEIQTVSAAPAVDDGQLLFLMEMVSKMKTLEDSPAGSRIATVHNVQVHAEVMRTSLYRKPKLRIQRIEKVQLELDLSLENTDEQQFWRRSNTATTATRRRRCSISNAAPSTSPSIPMRCG